MSDQAQGADTAQTTTPQGGTAQQPAPVQAAPQVDVQEAIRKGLESLMSKAGTPDRAAEILYDDNKKLRDRNRELESQAQTATQQAETLSAYKALGDDPKAISELLDKGRAAIEREHARELADVSGANARVLADRLKLDGLTAEVKEVKVDGKDVKQVHIVKDGEDLGELKAYAEANWPDYTTALFPQNQQRPGVSVIPQAGATAQASAQDPVTAALNRNTPQSSSVVSAFDFSGEKK